MIAAIYARRSTEQIGVNDEEKSVNAQVESKTSSWRKVQGNLKQLYEFASYCHCAPCVVSPTGLEGFCKGLTGSWAIPFQGAVSAACRKFWR